MVGIEALILLAAVGGTSNGGRRDGVDLTG
jgi:hypothetical protein